MAPRDWISFWDSDHSIYVNARHRQAHYRRIAEDLAPYAPRGGAMLDFGCGEALSASLLAERTQRLVLSDAAPGVRAGLAARFSAQAGIEVKSPEEVAALPDQSFDTIVMHSVAQYLSRGQLDAALGTFRRLLRRDGRLVLGDIVPPDVSPAADAAALMRFALHEGFAMAAFAGLVRTAFSDYRKLRTELGLARYREDEMIAVLRSAGFAAERAAANVGHSRDRMTFVAKPA